MVDQKADIALVGLGIMGRSLALNFERNGFRVACYNREREMLDEFLAGKGKDKNLLALRDLAEIPGALETPRRIFLMITAGKPVDDVIERLLPHLTPGDIIIDGGNSHYADTTRRTRYLESKGLLFVGAGVSGGEQGALWGPSIMPGGSVVAWPRVREMLQKIAAKTEDGTPCCDWIGGEGAGHFVKMVHNGIEYADMQLIAEAYFLLKNALGMDNAAMANTFAAWNRGELDSYLIGVTADILTRKDPDTGETLVDMILDAAEQKGTGRWVVEAAFDLDVPVPTIAEAVAARNMSALKHERVAAEKSFGIARKRFTGDKASFAAAVRNALFASKICAYAQGFALLRGASDSFGWSLDCGRIAMLWREGCIIRARFLERIKAAYDRDPRLPNLLLDPFFKNAVEKGLSDWRKVVSSAVKRGYSIPAFSSALAYFDAYTCGRLPANLLQAQRDYFGAHTYQRIDKEGTFHSDWPNLPIAAKK